MDREMDCHTEALRAFPDGCVLYCRSLSLVAHSRRAGAITGLVCAVAVYRLFLWPYLLSPMRHAPGPPLGHLIYGQWPEIIRNEAGIIQREWAKKYGPTVRAIGPVGVERMTFLSPEAMHKILVSDCFEYPRVRSISYHQETWKLI